MKPAGGRTTTAGRGAAHLLQLTIVSLQQVGGKRVGRRASELGGASCQCSRLALGLGLRLSLSFFFCFSATNTSGCFGRVRKGRRERERGFRLRGRQHSFSHSYSVCCTGNPLVARHLLYWSSITKLLVVVAHKTANQRSSIERERER